MESNVSAWRLVIGSHHFRRSIELRTKLSVSKNRLRIVKERLRAVRCWRNPVTAPHTELAPLCEAVGGLYTTFLAKPAYSGQFYRLALAQGFAAGGVVTISGKMELFGGLCRGGVEIG